MSAEITRETLQRALRDPEEIENGYVAFCPSHESDERELRASLKSGTLRLICRAGCDSGEVAYLLGLDQGEDAEEETPGRTFRLLSLADLGSLPRPEPIIDGVLDKRTLSMLSGPSGGGKSFLALSWALAVASGKEWHGHAVSQGRVAYVAAEGASGYLGRVYAWAQENDCADEIESLPLAFIPEAPQVAKRDDRDGLIRTLKAFNPDLVIVDTLARVSVGMEENSATSMGEVVSGLDQIKEALGCTVLVVHHSGKAGNGARGSTALIGAMDSAFRLDGARDSDECTLWHDKQKDRPVPKVPMNFAIESVEVARNGGAEVYQSAVLRLSDGARKVQDYSEERQRILRHLESHGSANKGTLRDLAGIRKEEALALLDKMCSADDAQGESAPLIEWTPERKRDGSLWPGRGTYGLTEAGAAYLARLDARKREGRAQAFPRLPAEEDAA